MFVARLRLARHWLVGSAAVGLSVVNNIVEGNVSATISPAVLITAGP